jgi:signal transduction histidine kinase
MLVIWSSSYFINSIVTPVGEIGETAKKIAEGDFESRLVKKNDDEIGELCDAINNMAGELGATEKIKNDFISSVSHELRTPLTAIKGWSETILSSPDDREITEKGMRVITAEAERLSSMVEELLDFSRMQSGRLTMIYNKMDVFAELEDAVLMFTQRAKRENITLEFNEPAEIGPMIIGDKNRIKQVFVNIIDNAIKYSDSGDKVTVDGYFDEENIFISVADTGCGIKKSDLPKIKTKFYKANLTRRGSGIGLALADEIVKMHGGSLEIDSEENVGTTVEIKFPINNIPLKS